MPTKTQIRDAKTRFTTVCRERPLEVLIVSATVLTAAAKLTSSIIEVQNANTWKKEVKRRTRKDQD